MLSLLSKNLFKSGHISTHSSPSIYGLSDISLQFPTHILIFMPLSKQFLQNFLLTVVQSLMHSYLLVVILFAKSSGLHSLKHFFSFS